MVEGELLLAKCKDAHAKISEHEGARRLAERQGLQPADFERFLAEELEYLRGVKWTTGVREEDAVWTYVKTLQKWWDAKYASFLF